MVLSPCRLDGGCLPSPFRGVAAGLEAPYLLGFGPIKMDAKGSFRHAVLGYFIHPKTFFLGRPGTKKPPEGGFVVGGAALS